VPERRAIMLSLFSQTGLRFLWISVLVVAIDLATKQWVIDTMTLYQSTQLLPIFNLTYVRNYGAAFSFLHDASGWQRWFFTAIAIVVSIIIVMWMKASSKEDKRLPIAFSFILGGALGNLYDRVTYGYVVDFLDFYIGQWHWPAFNVADSAIFIGATLMVIDMLLTPRNDTEKQKTS